VSAGSLQQLTHVCSAKHSILSRIFCGLFSDSSNDDDDDDDDDGNKGDAGVSLRQHFISSSSVSNLPPFRSLRYPRHRPVSGSVGCIASQSTYPDTGTVSMRVSEG
jgi:hypothetical protein